MMKKIGLALLDRALAVMIRRMTLKKCEECGKRVESQAFIHAWDECADCHEFRQIEWELQDQEQARHEILASLDLLLGFAGEWN